MDKKPERFVPEDDHAIDNVWGLFNALETISAQLDYLIELNKPRPKPNLGPC